MGEADEGNEVADEEGWGKGGKGVGMAGGMVLADEATATASKKRMSRRRCGSGNDSRKRLSRRWCGSDGSKRRRHRSRRGSGEERKTRW